jgi:hypothetical protein
MPVVVGIEATETDFFSLMGCAAESLMLLVVLLEPSLEELLRLVRPALSLCLDDVRFCTSKFRVLPTNMEEAATTELLLTAEATLFCPGSITRQCARRLPKAKKRRSNFYKRGGVAGLNFWA